MSKNSIDKLFKDRLSKYEEPYPQHLWEGVYDGITGNVSRKRKGFLWYRWMLLGVILLMATGGGWYLWQSGQSDEAREEMRDGEILSMDSSQALLREGSISGTTDQQTDHLNKEASVVSNEQETGARGNAHAMSAEHEGRVVSDQTSTSGNMNSEGDGSNASMRGRLLKKDELNRERSVNSQEEGHVKTNSMSGSEKTGHAAVSNSNTGNLYTNQKAGRSGTAATQGIESLKNFRLSEDVAEENERLMRDALPELNSYRKRRFVGHWGVAAVYGQDLVNRSLSIRSGGDQALLNQRSETESFVNAFVTGFEINMKVRQWSIYSGLHYTQINERVNYTLSGTERTVNGNPVVGDLKRSVVNRYQMMSIPLYLGYEVTRGPWAIEIQGGVNLGLSMNTSGEVFDRENLSYVEYDNNSENNPYQDNPGMSWHGALMLSYKTGYGQRIFIRPNIRWYGSSFTKEEYGLEQQYQSYGLMAGYRINL